MSEGWISSSSLILTFIVPTDDIKVEYREIRGRASCTLKWQRPGQTTYEVIGAAYLYVARHVQGSPFRDILIQSAKTSAAKTVVSGRAVSDQTAGVRASFRIHARDAGGNPREAISISTAVVNGTSDDFKIVATLQGGNPEVANGFTFSCFPHYDLSTATVEVTCENTVSGDYLLSVTHYEGKGDFASNPSDFGTERVSACIHAKDQNERGRFSSW